MTAALIFILTMLFLGICLFIRADRMKPQPEESHDCIGIRKSDTDSVRATDDYGEPVCTDWGM